jgi:hypothetical protein
MDVYELSFWLLEHGTRLYAVWSKYSNSPSHWR